MAESYRLLVTGSRDWVDAARVWGSLQAIADQMPGVPLVIVHGDAGRGVDRIARRWVLRKQAYGHPEITEERHPVTSEQWARLGRRAGMLRNEAMVEAGADACFAWITACSQQDCRRADAHGSHGATHCADRAEGVGIRTTRWYDEALLRLLDVGELTL